MSKLEELRQYVSKLFETATDKDIISQAAVVNKQIDDIEAETKASQESYNSLLKDYKDVVLHSSFKPKDGDKGADIPNASFDPNSAFEAAIKKAMESK